MNYSNSVDDVVKLNVTIWVEDGGGEKLKSLHSKLNRVYAGPSNKNLTPGKNCELDLLIFLLTMNTLYLCFHITMCVCVESG